MESSDSRNASPLLSEGSGEASGGTLSYAERKEQQKKIRKAQRAVDESEAKIAKLEARKSELDELLMAPENASNMELVTEYTNLQRELDEENDRWLVRSEELETLNLELWGLKFEVWSLSVNGFTFLLLTFMAYIHFLTDITDEQMEQISFFATVMHRDLTVLDDTDFRDLSA